MTDEQIIKALECCCEAKLNKDCKKLKCPFFDYEIDSCTNEGDMDAMYRFALDLINRQKAEILRLQNKVEILEMEKQILKEDSDKSKSAAMGVIKRQDAKIERLGKDSKRLKKVQMQLDDAMKMYSTIKAEAVKEFAERLKETSSAKKYNLFVTKDDIDNLVKEMVGEADEN